MAAKDTAPQVPTDLTNDREAWLRRAAEVLRPMIKQVSGIDVPEFRVSMGHSGQGWERRIKAATFPREADEFGVCQVYIDPGTSDTADVLHRLVHSMLHVALESKKTDENGLKWTHHDGEFIEYAMRLGLTAPYTVAKPDTATAAELMVIAAELGPFPHGALTVRKKVSASTSGGAVAVIGTAGKPDKNRWVSVQCPHHGRPWRASRTALSEGLPFCGVKDEQGVPCLAEMVAKD